MVGVVVYFSHPAQILPKLQRLGPVTIREVLLLNIPVLVLRIWRADLVLRRLGHRVPLLRVLAVQLVGQTSSTLTPAAQRGLRPRLAVAPRRRGPAGRGCGCGRLRPPLQLRGPF